MNILTLVASKTGNTRKVAETIHQAVLEDGHDATLLEAAGDAEISLMDYDIVFTGTGVYDRQPAKPMNEMIDTQMVKGVKEKLIVPAAPRRPGKFAVLFCTYGGVHTGVNEAIPAVKRVGQLFDHYGFEILDEWYVVGAFKPNGMQQYNFGGRLGDISNRPNQADLDDIFQRTKAIILTASRQAVA